MLYSILEILFRHRLRYLILLVVLPVIGAAVCIPLFPKSTASEALWVQDQTYLGTVEPNYDAYSTPAELAQADLQQFSQTQTFADGVKKRLLQSHQVTAAEASSIAGGVGTDLASSTSGNNLLEAYFTCTKASLCVIGLTASIAEFEQLSANATNAQIKVAENAYKQQLKQASQQLSTATSALNTYLAKHPGENQQTTSDTELTALTQDVTNAQSAVQTIQGKVSSLQEQSASSQISAASLYSVVDPPKTAGGHIKNLPTKDMLIVAVLFWAIAALSILVTIRVSRVVRHPNQIEPALGVPLAAVLQPIPTPATSPHHLPRLTGGADA